MSDPFRRALALLVLLFVAPELQAACLPDPPSDGATIVCDGVDSTGYDASGATDVTITTVGAAVLDDSNPGLDSAILVGDLNTVTIGTGARVFVTEADGFGIRGNNDNFVDNRGTITIDGADGRGISLNQNTNGILPNGAVNSFEIFANGERSVGLEASDNTGIANLGRIDVVGNEGRGISAGDQLDYSLPANLSNSGVLNVIGNDAYGIKAGSGWFADSLDMNGQIVPTGAGIFNSTGATIIVDGDRSFGIRGESDSWAENLGTITINGAEGRGISLGENTTGISAHGAENDFEIFAQGARSIGLETGTNTGALNNGTLVALGDQSRGISAADRTNYAAFDTRNIGNLGVIDVIGNGAYGIKAGDGWIEGSLVGGVPDPPIASIFNAGEDAAINVSGSNAVGIFAGNELNLGNNNSLVFNSGLISVTGTDAIGISIGGNDLASRFIAGGNNSLAPFSLDNRNSITGDADSGPLVVLRTFVAGFENRILNTPDGQIIADLTNQGMTDRGIAIRGSDGDDFVANQGEIQGDIEFGAGDDRYLHAATSTLNGGLLGGAGRDEVLLNATPNAPQTFDLSPLSDFEVVGIGGGNGWALSNSASFVGLTEVRANGRLQVPDPITLGGALSVDPTGFVEVTLDGVSAPLTVQGLATLDGTLIVHQDPGVTANPTPYRIIFTNGGRAGVFSDIQFPDRLGIQFLTPSYDAMGVVVLVEEGLVLVAQGANQRAIAQHLADVDVAGGASPDLQNLIDELSTTTGNVSRVYQTLSPEVYDVHTTVVVEGGRRVTNLLLDRPRECEAGELEPWRNPATPLTCHPRTWSPWLATIGGFRSREKNGEHPRYDAQLGGLAVGIDGRPIDDVDLTFAISSQRGSLNAAGAGEATVTLTDISGLAAWTVGPMRLQGVASWGHGIHRDLRLIHEDETTTALDSRAETNHDSDRISIAGELGYAFEVGPITLEPIAGVDWAFVNQRAIHEDSAGGFGIRIAQRDDEVGSVNAGLRLSTTYQHSRYLLPQLEWMDGVWRPMLDLRWREMLAGDKRDIDARFQGSPDAVSDFTITGKEDSGGAELGLGVNFIPKHANRLQFDLRYEAYVAAHTLEQDLFARVSIGF